jgi:glycerol-3-phosphate acyltransferase PlsX
VFRRIDVKIVDAPERVEMAESPAQALRRKPRASIKVAADAVRDGAADALFSAGHTGASVMAAHAAFGLLPGVDGPAIATIIPTRALPSSSMAPPSAAVRRISSSSR